MGTVLAMRRYLLWVGLALMSACGPLNEGRGDRQILGELGKAVGLGGEAAPTAPAALPPEVANARPGEVLLVTLRARGAVAPMVRIGENGNRVTWISPGKVSMTFDDAVLISTRGLGDDLMGADVPGLSVAIRAGAGTVQRRHSFIDSLDQIRTSEMTCTVSRAGVEEVQLLSGPRQLTRVDEACKGARLVFDNVYWLDGGRIVKSRQAISPTQGFIDAEQL